MYIRIFDQGATNARNACANERDDSSQISPTCREASVKARTFSQAGGSGGRGGGREARDSPIRSDDDGPSTFHADTHGLLGPLKKFRRLFERGPGTQQRHILRRWPGDAAKRARLPS